MLDDLIKSAKAELGESRYGDQEVLLGGELVTFRFTKMEPLKWREMIAVLPPRPDSTRDLNLGYNYDRAVQVFPVANIQLVDGEEVSNVSQEQWDEIILLLESPDLFNIATLLWGLHEFEPAKAVDEAKKSRASKKKSSSSRKS